MSTDRPRWTPPGWANRLMGLLLCTPGIQRFMGRSVALLTFTGRRSGASYTTPISYTRHNGGVVLTGHVSRQWWRNLDSNPHVRVRIAGAGRGGTATILEREEALPVFVEFLAQQPLIAKGAGIDLTATGEVNVPQAESALDETVVVVVDLDRALPSG